ncbi:hypothetical protein Goe24_00790 [Bacillus phage vB_BsuM-Goe24]|uniref:Repressor Rok winged helix domain-containing protein n=1 Tax=Bacillus phage vB_BsuM-Goe3 TaxID=1933063 RepID=A0A217ER35_BPGO3|nr:hypothetical protein HWB07_gp228 [Bacillus phage vB_BsuM-Goe3]APZ82542.1 hypothetical protein Goe3_c08100 [Bacillus phage vB_BsuM-Goe3]QDP43104.1 hypothetical protein Goe7_c00790 [Bacillus phage vB_BveM-Goe7]WCS69454.1 hypothetical protein Goe24_00790 [Bacillus phage vB_BsuM-Goe24]
MNNTFTEREAIEMKLKYILEERTRLSDQFNFYLDRLRELDSMDSSKLSKTEATVEVAKHGETMSLDEAIKKHNEAAEKYDESPKVQADHKDEEHKKESPKNEKKTKRKKESGRGKGSRNNPYRDIKKISYQVASILKEAGKPVKLADLMKELQSRGVSTHSPHMLMIHIQKYQPKVQKAAFGYYQYNHSVAV